MASILPFRYPGGKYYALPKLRPFWQSLKHQEYREPFVGGGAVFFDKPYSKISWINDLDDELITTYLVLQNEEQRERLELDLRSEDPSKERWNFYFREFKPTNEFEIAKRYFYLNRVSFSGKLQSAAYGYRPKRSVPPSRWKEKIFPAGKKLEGARITNFDFEKVIREESEFETLIFVDPPYFNPSKNKHYRKGFDYDDHIRLENCLRETKHNFFLTYESDPDILKLYKWANIYELKFTYRVGDSNQNATRRKTGNEVIIANYELNEVANNQYALL